MNKPDEIDKVLRHLRPDAQPGESAAELFGTFNDDEPESGAESNGEPAFVPDWWK